MTHERGVRTLSLLLFLSGACLNFTGTVSNTLRIEGQACSKAEECAQDLVCAADECRMPCNGHSDCDSLTQHCDEGICWQGSAIQCGNGTLDPTEECDDGGTVAGDGCNPFCREEEGWICSEPPYVCVARCGDGRTLDDEVCDDGNNNSHDDCPSGPDGTCRPATCGDGRVWNEGSGDEECDAGEGNSNTAADACRASCRLPWCGDGVIDTDEECDLADDNSDTAEDGCRTDCRNHHCGDGVKDSAESCDDGPGQGDGLCLDTCSGVQSCGDSTSNGTETCDDGPGQGDGLCLDDCSGFQTCGDQVINGTEVCDQGSAINSDTWAVDAHCNATCTGSAAFCGDEATDSSHEDCDDGTANNSDQWAVTEHCNANCTAPAPFCGDETIDTGHEDCDDGEVVSGDGCSNVCVLEIGWACTGQPSNCTETDECATNPCLNGSSCVDGMGSYTCECVGDFFGQNCQLLSKQGSLAAGGSHTCFVLETGGVRCWGSDVFGQLGDGLPSEQKSSPVDVVGIDGSSLPAAALTIAAGAEHACAVLATGAVKCWGSDLVGSLGDGLPFADQYSPVDVVGIDGTNLSAVSVAGGGPHPYTCALLTNGAAKCWGMDDGQDSPVDVVGLDGTTHSAIALASGGAHACAVLDTGTVQCWGNDQYGQLGNGASPQGPVMTPVDVEGIDGVSLSAVAVTAGREHSCAILATGAVQCWGRNDYGQLGLGYDGADCDAPAQVTGIDGTAQSAGIVAAGDYHTCAVLQTGALKCWGNHNDGQLGIGVFSGHRSSPTDVVGIDGTTVSAVAVAGGTWHTCAVLNTGGLQCWGYDGMGQLGNGDPAQDSEWTPVDVMGIP